MANPHRSLLSTLTSVEETHARYRCTTAIRFSSYSHCLQTTKLKVKPNKKIIENNSYAQSKSKLDCFNQFFGYNLSDCYKTERRSNIKPTIGLATWLLTDKSKKVPTLGKVRQTIRKKCWCTLVPLLPIGLSTVSQLMIKCKLFWRRLRWRTIFVC